LEELVVDRDMAQQGKLAVRKPSRTFADGTAFAAPEAGPLPVAVEVPEDAAGLSVWLTLPERSQNGRDVGLDDHTSATTRYRLATETVADNASSMRTEHQLEIAVPCLELAIRETPKRGYQCLRLVRINKVRDGVISLDDTVPQAGLVLAVHPVLEGFLSRVIG